MDALELLRRTVIVIALLSISCRSPRELEYDRLRSEIELLLASPPADLISIDRDWDVLIGELSAFYRVRDDFPVWYDDAALSDAGRAVLGVLSRADEHGLRVDDYINGVLAADGVLDERRGPADAARLDVAVSVATMRYVKDLHEGRVSPEALGLDLVITHHHPKLSLELDRVAAAASGEQAVERLESFAPPYEAYQELKRALATYRALEKKHSARPLADDAPVHPGETYGGLDDLRRRLRDTGDLPESSESSGPHYDDELVAAVTGFQIRHGLDADGVIGARTFAALNISWTHRVAQIVASMERWRWVSGHFDGKSILVNIPEFELRGLQMNGPERRVSFESRVVVGRHYDELRTPIFTGKLAYIDFRPFWNVPVSIIRNELSGRLDEPGFLERNDYEIVRDTSLDAQPLPSTPENTAKVRAGALRLRQRPGPRNALGLIKFIFPNPYSVFLHASPAIHLFRREERAFSHGCVRVADALDLAEWILRDQPGWDRRAIAAAASGGPTTRVLVEQEIQVVILYLTAYVDDETGQVHFGRDVYELDASLLAAIGQ